MDLTPLSTTVQLYCVDQIGWWRKPDHTGETTDMSEGTDELFHIVLNRTRSLVVIGTDCIGSCKSYYIAFTTTTVPH